MKTFRAAFICASFALATTPFAKPPFLKAFLETYKIKPTSKLAKARCMVCHMPPGPQKRNPYGVAVRDALQATNSRFVTAEILKMVEQKDCGDGVKYIAKIKHDELPGSPKPKDKPKPTKKKKKKA